MILPHRWDHLRFTDTICTVFPGLAVHVWSSHLSQDRSACGISRTWRAEADLPTFQYLQRIAWSVQDPHYAILVTFSYSLRTENLPLSRIKPSTWLGVQPGAIQRLQQNSGGVLSHALSLTQQVVMTCRKVSYASTFKNSEGDNGYKHQLHQKKSEISTLTWIFTMTEILRKL